MTPYHLHLLPGQLVVDPVAFYIEASCHTDYRRFMTFDDYPTQSQAWQVHVLKALHDVGASVYVVSGFTIFFGILGCTAEDAEARAIKAYASIVDTQPAPVRLWVSTTGLIRNLEVYRDPLAHKGTRELELVMNATKFLPRAANDGSLRPTAPWESPPQV